MTLELTDHEALVLFEWLSRMEECEAIPFEDHAEEIVLWSLNCQLERALSEPFRADYPELVKEARARVRESFGAK